MDLNRISPQAAGFAAGSAAAILMFDLTSGHINALKPADCVHRAENLMPQTKFIGVGCLNVLICLMKDTRVNE